MKTFVIILTISTGHVKRRNVFFVTRAIPAPHLDLRLVPGEPGPEREEGTGKSDEYAR
ncbi:hypothetical protein G3N56_15120 [Desulfovibrio sulfodismutans]|uniref:Uncharacterized protein n=1 Tax=Desulfolutivibrio sulfodismutans TaxID=63561 RepID=A0A7K3NQK0_9BACT|nr:hypothetical protein [Desulfolutivibrio sulfodismutans]NDY58065.1 hypothetical protein [Desulfolutivibrio sulfodismutans]